MKDQEKPFYVYVHRRATDGRVFYVGKGKGGRFSSSYGRNKYWHRISGKHGFTASIVMRFTEEDCAFSFERALIKHYGRDNLCNASDGGEGPCGLVHTSESRAKMSASRIGKKKPRDAVEKTASAHRGMKRSQETRNRISQAQIGVKLPPRTEEFKMHMSKLMTGRIIGDEQIKLHKDMHSIPVVTTCGMTFMSATSAAKWLSENGWPKANQSGIGSCARGCNKSAYGYKWNFIDIEGYISDNS